MMSDAKGPTEFQFRKTALDAAIYRKAGLAYDDNGREIVDTDKLVESATRIEKYIREGK